MEEGSRNEAGGRNEDEDPGGHPTGGMAKVNEGGGGDLRVTVSLTTHQQQDVTMEGKGILDTPGVSVETDKRGDSKGVPHGGGKGGDASQGGRLHGAHQLQPGPRSHSPGQ